MSKIICEIDGSILTGEKSLYAHNKIHLHEEYKCKFCMKVFKTEKDRNEHQNSVHSEEKLECNECDEMSHWQNEIYKEKQIPTKTLNWNKSCFFKF